ncbi:site-specific integrase [Micromonospora sp. NPDC005305]|uniref:site-specific integrase n=1 Tax=Micromonospora sp. NPDC005305 TaxID=3156875 RepID=UPI0033B95A25
MHRSAAKSVRPPAMKQVERRALGVDEAKRLLDALRGHRLEALYVCALTVGLCRGELLGLAWSDIDFDAGTQTVRQTVQRAGGRLQIVAPKTEPSRRTVPVPARTLALFRAHRRQQAADRLAAGERWQDHGLVFPSRSG